MNNHMELTFVSKPENEAFARMVISAFLLPADPTLSMISEIRTAVSEAVTNVVVHAYGDKEGRVVLRAAIEDDRLDVEIEDFGCGISDIEQAIQPFFTSQPQRERTGMGFSLMQSFMDRVQVDSSVGRGTVVRMSKILLDNAS